MISWVHKGSILVGMCLTIYCASASTDLPSIADQLTFAQSKIGTLIKQIDRSSVLVADYDSRAGLVIATANLQRVADITASTPLPTRALPALAEVVRYVSPNLEGEFVPVDPKSVTHTITASSELLAEVIDPEDPIVSRFSPTNLPPQLQAAPFEVSIYGSHLSAGDPTLAFGTVLCQLRERSSSHLTFFCPSGIFAGLTRTTSRIGKLVLARPRSFNNVILHLGARDPVSYSIEIIGLSPVLGAFSLRATVPHVTTETQDRTRTFSLRGENCGGITQQSVRVSATDGWKILPSSVNTNVETANGEFFGPKATDISSTSFIVTATLKPHGPCSPFFQNTGEVWLSGNARWSETRDVSSNGTADVVSGILAWDKPVYAKLPEHSAGFSFSILPPDGVEQSIAEPGDYGLVSVSYDASTNTVGVIPKAPFKVSEDASTKYFVIAMTSESIDDLKREVRRVLSGAGDDVTMRFPKVSVYAPQDDLATLLVSSDPLTLQDALSLKKDAISAGFSKDTWLWKSSEPYFAAVRTSLRTVSVLHN